ncbi:MAG: copper resistance protein CopC [Actinobacteria bacterium]|nr:copper resistance protein CopC [Actinomycetota bacterium]
MFLVAAVAGWLTATAAAGWAHASFVSSQPEPGADLAAAPGVVTLEFSEPLIEDLSFATVTDPTGRDFTAGPGGSQDITVDVESTAQGEYRVEWRTVSPIDGHTLHGEFTFGVGADVGQQDAPSNDPTVGDLTVGVFRVMEYVGLLGVLGLLSLAALAAGDELGWAPRGLHRWAVVAFAGGVLTVAGEVVLASTGSPLAAARSFLSSPTGAVRAARLVTEALAGGITVAAARRAGGGHVPQRRARVATTLLALSALALLSAGGHAAASGIGGVVASAGHLWTAGVWAGAILVMAVQRPPGGWRGDTGRALIRAFTPIAITTFAATVLLGSVRGWQELAHLSDLWSTRYGILLTAKITLVAAMVPLSVSAWRRDRPRPRAEGGLALGVVVLAGALASFPVPPARGDDGQAPDAATDTEGFPQEGDLTLAEAAGTTVVGLSVRPGEPGINDVYVRLVPATGADDAGDLDTAIAVAGGEPTDMRVCGTACRVVTLPLDGGERLDVTVAGDDGGTATFDLPEISAPDGSALAAALTRRMQQVDSLRYDEVFGPSDPPITSEWEIVAPDQIHGIITGGADYHEIIRIGDRRWSRDDPDGDWKGGEPGDVPVKANRFIWDYRGKTAARIVGTDTVDGVETRIVTFYVLQGRTSIWYRLWVDDDDRVRQAEMKAQGHFMDHRYFDFDEPISIRPPTGSRAP